MINLIKEDLQNKFNSSFGTRDLTDNKLTASCRNWGQWELPEDGEDEEDCDYEELSSTSYNELQEIMADLKSKYIGYTFDYDLCEKNYIDFQVTKD